MWPDDDLVDPVSCVWWLSRDVEDLRHELAVVRGELQAAFRVRSALLGLLEAALGDAAGVAVRLVEEGLGAVEAVEAAVLLVPPGCRGCGCVR